MSAELVDASLNDVAFGSAGYVAVGSVAVKRPDGDFATRPAAWHSTDGQSWERTIFDGAPDGALTAVSAFGNRYVVVGNLDDRPFSWVSDDGRNWSTRHRMGGRSRHVSSLAQGPDGLVASGSTYVGEAGGPALAWRSADGVTWSYVELPGGGATAGGVGWYAGEWLLGGEGAIGGSPLAAMIWHSKDAIHWTRQKVPRGSPEVLIEAIAVGPGRVAVISGDTILTSTDGRNWQPTKIADAGNGLFDITPAGGGFVAVGRNSEGEGQPMATAWSTDGIHWQSNIETPPVRLLLGIVAVDDTLIGVGNRESGGAILASTVCSA